MDTDIRRLSREQLARLAVARFEEYRDPTRWLVLGFAGLILLLWSWDWAVAPDIAPTTLWLRAVAALVALLAGLALGGRLGSVVSGGLVYAAIVIIQWLYVLMLARLDIGHAAGVGGFLYFFLAAALLGLPFPLALNAAGTVAVTFAPHLWGRLAGETAFPDLQYATLVWPAGIICLLFHWSTGRLIIDRLHYRSRIEDLSLEDPLTGLRNRRALQDDFVKARELATRDERPLALLMLDIDRFKQINDRHGHAAGDRVLERLAALMRDTFRASDSLARIGGEEFVCLVSNTDLEQAVATGERLRRAVESDGIAVGGRRIVFTISLGATRVAPAEALETVLERADRALYQAKETGRNRLVKLE